MDLRTRVPEKLYSKSAAGVQGCRPHACNNASREYEAIEGAINICAPHPVPNAELMRASREAWSALLGFPSPNGCCASAQC